MNIEHIGFDLDDTLIPNSYLYHAPIWRCGLIISEDLGPKCPYASDLMALHLKTDKDLIETLSFNAERFPVGWVKLYKDLCVKVGLEPDKKVCEKLYATARTFQDGPFIPLPGVGAMLDALRADGRKLHLITAGDDALQRKKIEQSGLAPYFDNIQIVTMDKVWVLRDLFGRHLRSSAMVGDSLKSDIKPAVELGMTAVHVPSQTWNFVHADVAPASYHHIDSILDLPDLLRKIEQNP